MMQLHISYIKSLFYIFIFISIISCNNDESSIPPPKEQIAEKLKNNCFIVRGSDGSYGTGFMLENGWIATNYHVVKSNLIKLSYELISSSKGFYFENSRLYYDKEACNNIWVESLKIPNVDIRIERCYYNDKTDLAILKPSWSFPKEIEGLKIKTNYSTDTIILEPVGTDVYLLGNPIGLEGTFSEGVISGHRKFGEINYLQCTAPQSNGNSGGPLTNQWGNVVGIAVAHSNKGQNLNIAIPSDLLLQFCNGIPSAKLHNELDEQKESVILKSFYKFMRFVKPYLKFFIKYVLAGFLYGIIISSFLIYYLNRSREINMIIILMIGLLHIISFIAIIKFLQYGFYLIGLSTVIPNFYIDSISKENFPHKKALNIYLAWLITMVLLFSTYVYWIPYF